MGVFDFLDRVMGDSKLQPSINAVRQYGTDLGGAGAGTGAGAIAGYNDDITGFQDKINSGRVLPDSVYRSYGMLRGQIGDEQTRSLGALRAGIAQRRAQSGGLMSDEAGEEYNRLGSNDINNNAFGAIGNVGVAQSRDELSSTRDLLDRIAGARNNILNYGEFQQQLGLNARLAGINSSIQRHQDIVGDIIGGSSVATHSSGFIHR